jgi:hypothetical protein
MSGQRAGAGSDVDDELAGTYRSGGHDAARPLVNEGMPAPAATRARSGAARPRGHGGGHAAPSP